mgnify:CR=1 FL=1
MQNYDNSYEQVQKVMVVDTGVKRRFQVVLDSNNTASFTGSQFNATYAVDFKNCCERSVAIEKKHTICHFSLFQGPPHLQ